MQATGGYLESMERRVSRRLFRIPEDQRKLLDNADSWIEDLQARPHGLYSIPLTVLEGLRKFKSCQEQQASTSLAQPSPSQPSPPHQPTSPVLEASKDDEEEPARFVVSSPARSPQAYSAIDPATPHSWVETPPRPAVLDPDTRSEPQSSPLHVTQRPADAMVVASKRQIHIPPQSSPVSDNEIEFKVPDALIAPTGKTSKLVLPVPTPPSAQVIPSTFDKSSPTKPEFKRRRLMKVPDFDAQAKKLAARGLASIEQLANNNGPAGQDPKSTLVRTAVPSDHQAQEVSLIPATFRSPASAQVTRPRESPKSEVNGNAAGEPSSEAPESESLSSAKPRVHSAPEVSLDDQTEQEMPLIPATIEQPSDAQDATRSSGTRVFSRQQPANAGLTQVPDSEANRETVDVEVGRPLLSPSPATPLSPYEVFTAAYPSYGGSVKHYISAVYCIRGLEKSGQLPSFLYDDVIRAFIQEYSPYVASYDSSNADPASKPLKLITWYNLNTDTLRYTKNIVTRANLGDILRAYPNEVANLEASITPPGSAASSISNYVAEESDSSAEEEEEEDDEDDDGNGYKASSAPKSLVEEVADAPGSSLEDEVMDSQPADVQQERHPDRGAVQSPSIKQEASSSPPINIRPRPPTPEPCDVSMPDAEEEEAEPQPTLRSPHVPAESPPVRSRTVATTPQGSQSGHMSMKPPSRAASGVKRKLDSSRPASPASSMRSTKRTETSEQRLARWREFLTQRYQGSAPSSSSMSAWNRK